VNWQTAFAAAVVFVGGSFVVALLAALA